MLKMGLLHVVWPDARHHAQIRQTPASEEQCIRFGFFSGFLKNLDLGVIPGNPAAQQRLHTSAEAAGASQPDSFLSLTVAATSQGPGASHPEGRRLCSVSPPQVIPRSAQKLRAFSLGPARAIGGLLLIGLTQYWARQREGFN